MRYIEIEIKTDINGIEPIVATLYSTGITDVVVEDPRDIEEIMEDKETYRWDYLDEKIIEKKDMSPKITVYLEDTEENRYKGFEIEDAVKKLLQDVKEGKFGKSADFGEVEVKGRFCDDSAWKDKWKEYFKPVKISEKIVVKPTWEKYEKTSDELVLEIDPGTAFGTGTHETTSMCVEMLEKYMNPGDKVMDVGCGSGILSISAALLGASDAFGIDIDPIAVNVSQENIKLNRQQSVARAVYGDLTKGVAYTADIVVANLMADLIMILSDDVIKHLKEGGYFISSGILIEKELQVREAILSAGFKVIETVKKGEWCCIVAAFSEISK